MGRAAGASVAAVASSPVAGVHSGWLGDSADLAILALGSLSSGAAVAASVALASVVADFVSCGVALWPMLLCSMRVRASVAVTIAAVGAGSSSAPGGAAAVFLSMPPMALVNVVTTLLVPAAMTVAMVSRTVMVAIVPSAGGVVVVVCTNWGADDVVGSDRWRVAGSGVGVAATVASLALSAAAPGVIVAAVVAGSAVMVVSVCCRFWMDGADWGTGAA